MALTFISMGRKEAENEELGLHLGESLGLLGGRPGDAQAAGPLCLVIQVAVQSLSSLSLSFPL